MASKNVTLAGFVAVIGGRSPFGVFALFLLHSCFVVVTVLNDCNVLAKITNLAAGVRISSGAKLPPLRIKPRTPSSVNRFVSG